MPCAVLPHTRTALPQAYTLHCRTHAPTRHKKIATSAQYGTGVAIFFYALYSSSSDRDEMSRRVSRPYTREPVRDSLTTMGT